MAFGMSCDTLSHKEANNEVKLLIGHLGDHEHEKTEDQNAADGTKNHMVAISTPKRTFAQGHDNSHLSMSPIIAKQSDDAEGEGIHIVVQNSSKRKNSSKNLTEQTPESNHHSRKTLPTLSRFSTTHGLSVKRKQQQQ